jgi:hypothetical protein
MKKKKKKKINKWYIYIYIYKGSSSVDGSSNNTDLSPSANNIEDSIKDEQDDSDCFSWDGRSNSEAPQISLGTRQIVRHFYQ